MKEQREEGFLLKVYSPEIKSLTKVLWENSDVYKENPYQLLPKWFQNIMLKRGEGMLRIVMTVPMPWVVFPEYVPNYSLVVYKKQNEESIKKLKQLQMRYFENISAPKSDEFARLATSIFNKQVLVEQRKNVIKLEDEMLLMFSFPTTMLRSVLIALGASPDIKF